MSYTGYPTSSQYRAWPNAPGTTWPYMVESSFNVVMGATATLAAGTASNILGTMYFKDFNADTLTAGAVASWADAGLDGAAATQANASHRPTASLTSFGGNPGVTFSSASAHALGCTFATPIATGSRVYLWVVASVTSLAGANGGLVELSDNPRTSVFSIYNGDATHMNAQTSGLGESIAITGNTSRHVYGYGLIASTTGKFVIDATTGNGSTTNVDNAVFALMEMGNLTDESQGLSCVIRRVIVAHNPASKTDIPSSAQITAMQSLLGLLI